MRLAIAALTLLAVGLAGCTGSEPLGSTSSNPPQMQISGFRFEDKACSDDVPFSMMVRNAGSGVARSVQVTVESSGYAGYSTNLGDVNPGVQTTVSGTFRADDTCGVTDSIPVIIRAMPANGGGYEFTTAASI